MRTADGWITLLPYTAAHWRAFFAAAGRPELVERLGDVRYWYARGGKRVQKVVTFFLFSYRSGSVEDHDHEVEEALWIPLDEATRRLAYAGEREMAEAARSHLDEGR